jgi:hypothetical protein
MKIFAKMAESRGDFLPMNDFELGECAKYLLHGMIECGAIKMEIINSEVMYYLDLPEENTKGN